MDGKPKYALVIGALLLLAGYFVSVIAYMTLRLQADYLSPTRESLRSIIPLSMVFIIGCTLIGTIGGYLIGKYMRK